MSYNKDLAERIRTELKGTQFIEKTMFGGLGFIVHGMAAVAVLRDNLIVHVGLEKLDEHLKQPGTKPFDPPSALVKGFVSVSAEGYASDEQLKEWIKIGVDFVTAQAAK